MKTNDVLRMAGFAAILLIGAGTARANEKNWTPPAEKIYAQTLADETMAAHPELLSVTLHGTPPGKQDIYTMFAGSYHDRIGNADDPDDIDVIKKGITIVDPRWHRTKDTAKKFVIQTPLRDQAGDNIGLVVYAFHNNTPSSEDERKYYEAALTLRDELEKRISSYAALFEPAK